jgi:glutaminase
MFNSPVVGNSTIRLKFTAADLSSNRVRTPAECQTLRAFGGGVKVYQLQGDLSFATAEVVVREVVECMGSIQHLIFDLKRVLSINESACRLFYELLCKLSGLDKSVLFTHADRLPLLRQYMRTKLAARYQELFRSLDDNDLALEWCENRLVEVAMPDRREQRTASHQQYELFEGFSQEDIGVIAALLRRRSYQQSEIIINIGDEAAEMLFVVRGGVSVFVPLEAGGRKRLATFSAGMTFGEMAVIDRAPRSAMIVADSEVECDVLSLTDFERLSETHPKVKIKLLENLSFCLCRRLRNVNRKLSLFD